MSVPPHLLVPIHDASNPSTNHSVSAPASQLPFELVEALNQTYFLHLLVTQPEKVIPPGKSLLSMMTHANYVASEEDEQNRDKLDQAKAERQVIERKVKEVAHRAFWNEALESLSSPLPSVQLSRLKQLYLDLHEALAPLFPPGHPVVISLTSPLPPTSSPLNSTVNFLKELVGALRERCAPIRDGAVDKLAATLQTVPSSSPEMHTELAQFVLDSIRTILSLSEDMRKDLNTFVLGAMSESQLKSVLTRDVKKRERDLVVKLWDGQENVRRAWREWVSQVNEEDRSETKWVKRLLLALESDKAVFSRIPGSGGLETGTSRATHAEQTSPSNTQPHEEMYTAPSDSHAHQDFSQPLYQLPPQLLFSSSTLLYIQNYIQAIVISAALRALTRLPPSTTASSDFMQRVWTLLESEVDDGMPKIGPAPEESPTKIVNLADEVVRVRQLVAGQNVKPEDEGQLRATVERTLRATDPVFLLLRRRLLKALEERVVTAIQGGGDPVPNSGANIPMKMRSGTGRVGERTGKRMRLMLADDAEIPARGDETKLLDGPPVPGFEDPVLQQVMAEAVGKIIRTLSWTASVWGDLV